jgi:signal transduction histidine kinase
MWDILGRGGIWQGHFVNRHKNGALYEEEATISPVRDAAGKTINYVAVKRDVTREVQLEAQFRQSQKMEAVGQLAGGVAHDFNNILMAMLMQAELAESVENLPEVARDCIREIRAYTERAANLTRQLLLFSRRQVMQPRDIDLNEVVTNMGKMLQRIIGEDIRLQLRLHPAPLLTRADAGMLEQALMNLAVNARDAMRKGGRLLIETAEKTVDESIAQVDLDAAPGRYVCLIVSDTGCGIPPELLPRIFEPFFTTKEPGKGTGLGLATVFGIVKQHKGWLKVDSKPGQGVKFHIFLPAGNAAADLPETVTPSKPRGGTETILLVEDEWAVRTLTRAILKRHGYKVLDAPTGIEALKLWQEHGGAAALLLTDLVMPAGMSGQELARQLRAEHAQLKVIYISGYSTGIAGQELQLRKGERFIQKPFGPDQLLGTIRQCLDE